MCQHQRVEVVRLHAVVAAKIQQRRERIAPAGSVRAATVMSPTRPLSRSIVAFKPSAYSKR